MLALLFAYGALCDPHFDRREAATARLTHLVDRHPALYGPRLGEWCRGATCPEVRSRAVRILAGYTRWRVTSYVPSGVPAWPICDAFPVANPVVPFGLEDVRDRHHWPVCRNMVPTAGEIALMEGGPHWGSYRRTTEQRVRDMLREGATAEECDRLLSRMWALEVRSRHDCGVMSWPR